MSESLQRARDLCADITERQGPNFSVGFRTLPDPKRWAIQSSYAFCRIVDDLADDTPLDPASCRAAIARWRDELDAVYAGRAMHPVGQSLQAALEDYDIPRAAFEDLIRGCEADLEFEPFATEFGLERYCDWVATSIGSICLAVFGHRDPAAPQWARALAHALQMTNILRDLREDHERERHYLPNSWLAEAGLAPADLVPPGEPPAAWHALVQRGVDFARARYEVSAALVEDVDEDSRDAVALMRGVYVEILERIAADPGAVLHGRVGLSEAEKRRLAESRGHAPARSARGRG